MRLNILGICGRTKPDDTILLQYWVTYIFSPPKKCMIGARTVSSKEMKHLFLLLYINDTRGYSNSLSWLEQIPLCRGFQLVNVEGLKGKNNIRKSLFCNDGNFYNGGTGPSPLESSNQQQHCQELDLAHVPPEGLWCQGGNKSYLVFFPNKQKFNLNFIQYLNVSSN